MIQSTKIIISQNQYKWLFPEANAMHILQEEANSKEPQLTMHNSVLRKQKMHGFHQIIITNPEKFHFKGKQHTMPNFNPKNLRMYSLLLSKRINQEMYHSKERPPIILNIVQKRLRIYLSLLKTITMRIERKFHLKGKPLIILNTVRKRQKMFLLLLSKSTNPEMFLSREIQHIMRSSALRKLKTHILLQKITNTSLAKYHSKEKQLIIHSLSRNNLIIFLLPRKTLTNHAKYLLKVKQHIILSSVQKRLKTSMFLKTITMNHVKYHLRAKPLTIQTINRMRLSQHGEMDAAKDVLTEAMTRAVCRGQVVLVMEELAAALVNNQGVKQKLVNSKVLQAIIM